MKIRNVVAGDYAMFWDEGNTTCYPWHVKGWWKRYGRKAFIKNQLAVLLEAEMDYIDWAGSYDLDYSSDSSQWW